MQGRARFLCLDSRHVENVIGDYWFAGRWILGSCKDGEHISRALIVVGSALLFMSLLALRKSFACLLHRGESVVDWMSWSAKKHDLSARPTYILHLHDRRRRSGKFPNEAPESRSNVIH